ncbi:hypothetical protein MJ575_11625 [Klebsiella pneumoniae]|nr:hypothetical protein MJ575_11625 [Klebsiella pneumoniae]
MGRLKLVSEHQPQSAYRVDSDRTVSVRQIYQMLPPSRMAMTRW